MTYANYKRDAPLKCMCCRRWMRFGPQTKRVTQKRRPPPHAGVCTTCRRGSVPTYQPAGKTFCEGRGCNAVAALGDLAAGPRPPKEPEMPW